MKHAQYFDGASPRPIRPEVTRLGHIQFACARPPARPAKARLLGEQGHGVENTRNDETMRRATAPLSAAISVASWLRLRSAVCSHLSRIHVPLFDKRGDVLVAGEVTRVGLRQRRADFADLPLVVFKVNTDGFGGQE